MIYVYLFLLFPSISILILLGVEMLALDKKERLLPDGGILNSIEKANNHLIVVEAGQRIKIHDVPQPIIDLFFDAENPHEFYEENLKYDYICEKVSF